MGENGIVGRAKEGQLKTRIADIEENADIIIAGYQMENSLKLPTSRYTLEKLSELNKVSENEIVDYGDYTGVGIIQIENQYIYINGDIDGSGLRYELIPKDYYTIIRFYPKIETSDTYVDYATDIIYGKSDEQIKELVVEGWNYWVEDGNGQWMMKQKVNDYHELIDYVMGDSAEEDDYQNIDRLASWYGYSSARSMFTGNWKVIKPNEYDWDKEEVGKNFSIYDENNDIYVTQDGSTLEGYIKEYTVLESGTYTFKLIQESDEEIAINIYINVNSKVDYSNIFITNGDGTILGIHPEYYSYYAGCYNNINALSYIEIPEKIGDETITAIGVNAFMGYGLYHIKMPNTITRIEYSAFNSCYDLQKIDFSENITYIGDYAFSSTVWDSNLSDGEHYIGKVLYTYRGELPENTMYSIKDGTTQIAYNAFRNQSGLVDIEFPDSVTSIGGYTFYNCKGLTEIVLPDNVISIGNSAFYNCTNLISININATLEYGVFSGCVALKNIEIGENCTSIGGYAFQNCKALTEVVLPETLSNIEYGAFYNCTGLTFLIIPKAVVSIGTNAFYKVPVICYLGDATGSPWGALSVHNHELVVTKEATCTENGEGYYECEYSGQIQVSISKIFHILDENNICTMCGNEIHETIWNNASNGIYSFIQDDTKWISNNNGVSSTTATSTWTITLSNSANYSFEYGVSSESGWDKLTIKVDGTAVVNAISGVFSSTYEIELSAGEHTIEAIYSKDSSVNNNDDIGWIVLGNVQQY